MKVTMEVKSAIHEIGAALKRPEELAVRWRDRKSPGVSAPTRVIFPVLLVNAIVGLAAYGVTMRMHLGPEAMLLGALQAPLACGIAWSLALPGLYIGNSALGSKLDGSTTVLIALATCSFGALAMLASVPVNWFFGLALPHPAMRLIVNLVVFGGVGVCMADVFLRAMQAAEPDRPVGFAIAWLLLLSFLGSELFVLLDLFTF
jgi:hypothetical protein